MYYDVYIDIVFLTNLLMDYLLLRIVGKLFLRKRNRGRILLAAAIGALFSCLILYVLPDGIFPVKVLLHGGCAWIMLVLGLDLKKNGLLVKALVTVYLMAFLMGGLMEAAPVKNMTLIRFLVMALGAYMGLDALIYLSDSFRARWKNIYPVTLSYQGNVQQFFGLLDTGNLLVDPMNQKEVFVIKPEVLEAMMPEEKADRLRHIKENPGELEGTELTDLHPHFLPYQTIGEEGVMLAVVLEDLCIHTPREVIHVANPVLALAVEPSALGKEYQVLLNSRILH
ncbi:sigma-E processing peptidase SpoIIGA [Blautia sp.]|mgnify:FL=1